MDKVRLFFGDYVKWFPEEWKWELADEESRKLYMKFRARRGDMYHGGDKTPFFDSIEKDANQFGRTHVEFTDIFGIRWEGTKGLHRYVGDADYEQHMYYRDSDGDCDGDEDGICVSDEVTADKLPYGYAKLSHMGVLEFVDVADVVDVDYRYVVENHLFKDSSAVLSYNGPLRGDEDCGDFKDTLRVWDIHGIAKGLKNYKPDLYRKFLAKVDEHFKALQNSKREEERVFAPTDGNGKFLTASEYFDGCFGPDGD